MNWGNNNKMMPTKRKNNSEEAMKFLRMIAKEKKNKPEKLKKKTEKYLTLKLRYKNWRLKSSKKR